MGSSESTPPPGNLAPIEDSRYGGRVGLDVSESKVYQNLDIDEASLEHLSRLLQTRKELKHYAFITVGRTWVQEYREPCALTRRYRLTVEYPFLADTLQDVICKYCEKQQPVPEPEVKKYFFDVASCLEYLAANSTCHGDIKVRNILISPYNRAFLADSFLINGGRVSYQIVMEDPVSLCLLSPFQLQKLRGRQSLSLQQIHQDEMFALGLSMIETMTSEPAMQCYDLHNLRVKENYLPQKCQQMLSLGYSRKLVQLVMRCVEMDQNRRITSRGFLDEIAKIMKA